MPSAAPRHRYRVSEPKISGSCRGHGAEMGLRPMWVAALCLVGSLSIPLSCLWSLVLLKLLERVVSAQSRSFRW